MLLTECWMSKPYQPKDHYFRKAKQRGLRARSAFKIEEIAGRFGLFKRGAKVLDLGAAPGGFLQVIAEQVGPTGVVIGVDLSPIRPIQQPQVKTAVLDVLDQTFADKLRSIYESEFDVVTSDLAPKMSGIKSADQALSLRLASSALEIATARGRAGSHFVAKLFQGGEFEQFRDRVRQLYREVKVVRPEATRGGSSEVYVVGLSKRW
jgi:23S rRNA (uridine2552-2'-O)-methyltransferase